MKDFILEPVADPVSEARRYVENADDSPTVFEIHNNLIINDFLLEN